MKCSFIHTPTKGDNTLEARFVVPVKNANTVPSIFLGVIFANKASVGRKFIAWEITPKIVSVHTIKTISLICIFKWSRFAKAQEQMPLIILMMVE